MAVCLACGRKLCECECDAKSAAAKRISTSRPPASGATAAPLTMARQGRNATPQRTR